jgi:hypothetical protein
MVHKIRNLRRPVTHEANGHTCKLVTTGYVAAAVGRSPWTVRHWQQIGLLPRAPFILQPKDPRARRHLYPADFVNRLPQIIEDGGWQDRLERDHWRRFHREVFDAYDEVMRPLLTEVVTE